MQYLDSGLPVRELGHQDGQLQRGYTPCKVCSILMVAFLSGDWAGAGRINMQYLDSGLPVRELGHQDGQVGGPGGRSPHTLQGEKCCFEIDLFIAYTILVLEEWVAKLVERRVACLV